MGNVVEAQFDVQMFHRRGDASGFIARWNNDTKKLERWLLALAGRWSRRRGKVEPLRIALRVVGNFIENGGKVTLGSPVKLGGSPLIIHHQPWNIERARGGIRFDRMFSETFRAPAGKLRQRHGVTRATSDVERRDFRLLRVLDLLRDKLGQIIGMKPVSNLPAGAIKTNVF